MLCIISWLFLSLLRAGCVVCDDMTFIRIGSSQRLRGTAVRIVRHIIHPKYGVKHAFDYDVQLMELNLGLRFNDAVKPLEISDGQCGETITLTGWGFDKEKGDFQDNLQQVSLRIMPKKTCQEINREWYNHTLTSRMFCAGGWRGDACQGDSGGPAVSLGLLVGLSSFGYGCGRKLPGVYINVSHSEIRSWIYLNTGV